MRSRSIFFPIFEEPRPTKQFSSVLGCAFYFEFGRVPADKAEIDQWCKGYGITKATLIDGDVVRDEHEVALEFLLQHRVSVLDGSNQTRPYTIAELLSAALRPGAAGEKIDRKIACYQLEKNGIKIDFTNRWILLGRTHPGMRAIFAKTTVGNNFVDAFADLVDERDREKRLNAVNYAGGVKSRALLIRLAKIEERIFADDVADETENTTSANEMLNRLLALKIRCLNDEGRDSTHRIRDLINVVRDWGKYNGFVGREAANHALRSNGIYLGHENALRKADCKRFIAIAKNHPTLIELLGRGGNAIGKNYADILAPISVGESENIDFAGIEKAGIIVLDPAYARLEQMSEELDLEHFKSADVLTAFVSENKPSNPVH